MTDSGRKTKTFFHLKGLTRTIQTPHNNTQVENATPQNATDCHLMCAKVVIGQAGLARPLKGLVVVTRVGPVAEDLADVTVGTLFSFTAVVSGVWRRAGHLRLRWAVHCVVEVKAIADVTEKPWRKLLLCRFLVMASKKKRKSCSAKPRLLLLKQNWTNHRTYLS